MNVIRNIRYWFFTTVFWLFVVSLFSMTLETFVLETQDYTPATAISIPFCWFFLRLAGKRPSKQSIQTNSEISQT